MEVIFDKLLPALLGLIGGVIGGLVAPWVHWAVEKRRAKLNRRKDLVDSWRGYLQAGFDWNTFRSTVTFSQMKPYLPAEIVREIDPVTDGEPPTVHLRAPIGEDTLQKRLMAAITEIEKRWGLI